MILILAYAVLSAILPGILANSGNENPTPPEIIESLGESTHANKSTVYPYLNRNNVTAIAVESHKKEGGGLDAVSKFSMVRATDKNDENKLLDYFIFFYEDEYGSLKEYAPNISKEDAEFHYTDLYAKENADGIGARKIDYLMAALSALYFEERIALSSAMEEKNEQLNRYGLTREQRETILVEYVDENGQLKTHKIYVGDKLITGVGYYFMLAGRDYVYTSATSQSLSYALGGFESFLHSRVVAAELEGDKGAAPYHTKEYRQWNSVYHKTLGEIVPGLVDVIVRADFIEPIYKDLDGESDSVPGKGTGYRKTGYRDLTFDLTALSASPEFERLINALVGKEIGDFAEEKTVTVITDMNEATLYDAASGKGVYSYTIYKIESLLGADGEISLPGTQIYSDSLIKVEYSYTLDGQSVSSERSHAVIDLGANSAIPSDIKDKLVSAGVGELMSPVSFEARYSSETAKTRKIEYLITDISLIWEVDDKTQSLKPLSKVTENCTVQYTFRYLLDGVEIGGDEIMTVDLSAAKEGHYLNVKNALLGKKMGKQEISVIENVYCQPFMDFRAYNITGILGYVETEEVVAFKFIPSEQRDTFYGETIYTNILPKSNRYSTYAVNDEACDRVLRILGGIVAESNASGAQGVEGIETVAVGLSHKNMEKYGLYEGYRILFSLPRGVNPISDSEDYDWLYHLEFVLYIGERQPDGTRYVGSEMYDIVVKIDADTFDFLEFSFSEFWARRNLAMIDVTNIDKVGVEFNMEDVYGKYDLNLKHTTKYYNNQGIYPVKPEGESREYDFIDVRVRPLGDRHSDSELMRILAERNASDISLAEVYNIAAGIPQGETGLSVGYDTLGTSSFKDILRILYSTYYLGVVSEEDQAKGNEQNRLMRLSFNVGSSSAYTYNYDFFRIDDRRIMVSLYRTDTGETKIGEVSDFYISSFAFKKIVNSFQNLFNGVVINTETAY